MVLKILDALTQLLNVTLISAIMGHEDTNANESTSGRAFRSGWKLQRVIDFFLGEDHCKKAYLKDLERAKEYVERHKNV